MIERFNAPSAVASDTEVLTTEEQVAYDRYLDLRETAKADAEKMIAQEVDTSLTGYQRFAAIVDLMKKLSESPERQQYRLIVDQLALQASAVRNTLTPNELLVGARQRSSVQKFDLEGAKFGYGLKE